MTSNLIIWERKQHVRSLLCDHLINLYLAQITLNLFNCDVLIRAAVQDFAI